MSFWKEFKSFIARGNLLELAVGIMIGAAFNSIVQSFVKDLLTPIIGVFLGKKNISAWVWEVTIPGEESPIVRITYGNFLQTALDFLVLAVVIFLIVKAAERFKRKAEDEKNTEIPTPKDIQLLGEIRDLLKQNTKPGSK